MIIVGAALESIKPPAIGLSPTRSAHTRKWGSIAMNDDIEDGISAIFGDLIGQIGSSLKIPRGRGRAKKSTDLIEAMYSITEAAQPITGRGVGYKLFTAGLIPSMARSEMQRVYRLLKEAREEGIIPWDWIVDESRELERVSAWDDPESYTQTVITAYRRDYWNQQPARVEVWSEKGTVRGVLQSVLDLFGVGFRVMHGFSNTTEVHNIADNDDGRPLHALYVGDWDPSGLWMSEHDPPARLSRYDGDHVILERIALTQDQVAAGLPAFPAADKRKDPRHRWFVENFGERCWELDALDPNDLRLCVEEQIRKHIEPIAWEHCKVTERAEQVSLRTFLAGWGKP